MIVLKRRPFFLLAIPDATLSQKEKNTQPISREKASGVDAKPLLGAPRCLLKITRQQPSHQPPNVPLFGSHGHTDTIKTQPLEGLGWITFLVRVGAPRSLRIPFGGRIVRVGSPRSLRIAFGGRIVRVGAPPRRDLVNKATCARKMCCWSIREHVHAT
jgi:hypothetical protein